jgi:DNA-binding IclR family transcriptional regulator
VARLQRPRPGGNVQTEHDPGTSRPTFPMTARTPPNSIQVIARAASILRALEGEERGLSLGQIAERVKLARSTVQRIVDALRAEHLLIAATPTSGVRLGPALVRLAASATADFDQITRPAMTQLSQILGETVDLSVLKGSAAVFIDQIQGAHRLRAVSGVGESFPLHCTANGKALLGLMNAAEFDRHVRAPLEKLTPNTLLRVNELRQAVDTGRKLGYATDNEEHTEGISAIGTAFLDPFGRSLALSIPVPSTRFRKMRSELIKHLLEARSAITARLHPCAAGA